MLTSEWDKVREPNGRADSSGVQLLDDYIQQHYRTVKRFGEISVLLRNVDGSFVETGR